MKKKVIILGGGIAGLSAAHELIERGFAVEVFEKNTIPGGKARSVMVAHTGKNGRKDLPGEHGFRFFPGFYKHITDTMKRIPYKGNRNGVFDNLISIKHFYTVLEKHAPIVCLSRIPKSLEDFRTFFYEYRSFYNLGITNEDIDFFSAKLWQVLTSCEERRLEEYEKLGWWDFIDADRRSKEYQNYLGIGQTKVLVASDPKSANARTIATIGLQLIFNLFSSSGTDRILNGPTNEVWITPWLEYLTKKGVIYHTNVEVEAIHCSKEKITSISLIKGKKEKKIEIIGDYYIAALPVEVMNRYITKEMCSLEPNFKHFPKLASMINWMNGIQFYLTEQVDIIDGHESYLDSPWALTSLSQGQFWPDFPLSEYGDGTIQSILSVDIADWNTPGMLYKRPARNCTPEEIAQEVWYQLKHCLNTNGKAILVDAHLHSWFLDPDIQNIKENPHKEVNLEPLLVNLKDSWKLRPESITTIPNLFLASDYVRTNTDLATMEAANEAARRAVNGILAASESPTNLCRVWKLEEPKIFRFFQWLDRKRFHKGLPWMSVHADIIHRFRELHIFNKYVLKN